MRVGRGRVTLKRLFRPGWITTEEPPPEPPSIPLTSTASIVIKRGIGRWNARNPSPPRSARLHILHVFDGLLVTWNENLAEEEGGDHVTELNTFTVPNPDCAFMGVEYVCMALSGEKNQVLVSVAAPMAFWILVVLLPWWGRRH